MASDLRFGIVTITLFSISIKFSSQYNNIEVIKGIQHFTEIHYHWAYGKILLTI